jgi:hypothetical protein
MTMSSPSYVVSLPAPFSLISSAAHSQPPLLQHLQTLISILDIAPEAHPLSPLARVCVWCLTSSSNTTLILGLCTTSACTGPHGEAPVDGCASCVALSSVGCATKADSKPMAGCGRTRTALKGSDADGGARRRWSDAGDGAVHGRSVTRVLC